MAELKMHTPPHSPSTGHPSERTLWSALRWEPGAACLCGLCRSGARSLIIRCQHSGCTNGGARERPAVRAPGPGQSIRMPGQPERRDHSPQETGHPAPRSGPPPPHCPLPGQHSSCLAFLSSELILSLGHMASCLLPGTSWTWPPYSQHVLLLPAICSPRSPRVPTPQQR